MDFIADLLEIARLSDRHADILHDLIAALYKRIQLLETEISLLKEKDELLNGS